MSGNNRLVDVMQRATEGSFEFIDYTPRGVPGFDSNIARVFRDSPNQTKNLLEAVEVLRGDHHFVVEEAEVQPSSAGSHGKQYPKQVKVRVSAA